MHQADPFVKRYMRDIGHFEFGALHRPVAFPGMTGGSEEAAHPDYWLRYWIAAMHEVLRHVDQVHLVAQDDLRAEPEATMAQLCSALALSVPDIPQGTFHATPDPQPRDGFSPALLADAEGLYQRLLSHAVRPLALAA